MSMLLSFISLPAEQVITCINKNGHQTIQLVIIMTAKLIVKHTESNIVTRKRSELLGFTYIYMKLEYG